MAGVTHFEKRGIPKKKHPVCPFCTRRFTVTPRKVAGKPRELILQFAQHLQDCFEQDIVCHRQNNIPTLLAAMAEYARAVEREW